MSSFTSSYPSTLDFYREDKPQTIKKAEPTKAFNEKLNGRAAMLGLVIGAITGKGIIEQAWSFNQATAGFVFDFSFMVDFFS
jgi:hypothetical protein